MRISKVHARQILDSRGNPTVEADVFLENRVMGRAAVPSGVSTGTHEAVELRDNNPKLYGGKSVLHAVESVNTTIAQAIIGLDAEDQSALDQELLKLDGTPNKSKLGANTILAVSLAAAHATANEQGLPLFMYLRKLAHTTDMPRLPVPMMNIINGGKHADWATDLQEFLIIPVGGETFSHALQIGTEVFHSLGNILREKGYSTLVGDEGGYAPKMQQGNTEPFELISLAVERAGYVLGDDIVFGIDAAASEFYKNGKYILKAENKELSSNEMIEWLAALVQKYPIISLEDPLDQEDWEGWKKLTAKLGDKIQIIGDDLFVTNTEFLQKGIDEKAANAILIKPNQIGTLTETITAVNMADRAGFKSIISHRSGETEDTTIAHLAVGLAAGQIKTGSLSRTDRVSKYNELLRIEEILGTDAVYPGKTIFTKK